MSNYQKLLKKLFAVNLHGGMKLGLDNVVQLNSILGNPSQNYSCIHVAGSNGKGSVVTKIATALQAEGHKVGLYTSPHICTFRERIRVNGQLIDEETAANFLHQIFTIIERENIPATFFEITTMIALLYFALKKVDYAVLETGLGGRLDATNIVNPILTILTSISLEHTEYLGNSLEEITKEKSGIIKPLVPVIIGPCVPMPIVKQIAKENDSPFFQVTGHFEQYNDENNAIAKKALEFLNISEKSICEGLQAWPPCRMEKVQTDPIIILDVAHNPDGFERLFQALKMQYHHTPFRIVFGLSKNKDIEGCLHELKRHGTHFHLVEAPNGRGVEVPVLYNFMLHHHFSKDEISVDPDIRSTIKRALKEARVNKQILIICGSFFIMGEARAALGFHEPRDPIDVNEQLSKRL